MIGKREILAFVQLYFCVVITGRLGISKYNLVNGESIVNATRLKMFVDKLPNMPKLFGYEDVGGKLVSKSLTIGMFHKKWKFHRDLPKADVFAFGTSVHTATVPGPTIEARYDIDTYVTWENHLPPQHILPWDPTIPTAIPAEKKGVPTVVHLHGIITEPESDGHAFAWFTRAFKETGPTWTKKTYHYINKQQPGNLWYHDHAMGLTRVNILAGLLGAYVIRQPEVEAPLLLPYGDEFDRQLLIFDRSFYSNGSIYMNQTGDNPAIHPEWQPEYFGDVMVVNGKAWPYMHVRRRKYRFRIRNASNARFLILYFTNGLDFVRVGSDSAYLSKSVVTNETFIAPSEIADVIVDFSKSKSNTVILANDAPYPYPSGDPVNEANSKVMKFIINRKPEFDESRIPHKLLEYPYPNVSSAIRSRFITLYEYTSNIDEPTHLLINGLSFKDPITETPIVGSSEVWYVINLTEDNHPLHIHFALFSVLEQVELVKLEEFKKCMNKLNDAKRCNVNKHAVGQKIDVAAPERGWKNVYKMMPGFVTKLLVRFSYIHSNSSYPFDATAEPGYAYHCHILDHEDNVMMRPLKLVNH
ncbi:Multicopper oxidase lpr2 [Ancistrocladus abbreviatus]